MSMKDSVETFIVYGFMVLIMLAQGILALGALYVIVHFAQKYWQVMKAHLQYTPPPEPQGTYELKLLLTADERLDLILVMKRSLCATNSQTRVVHEFIESLGVKA